MSICRAKVKIYMCMGSAAAISQPVSNTSGSFTEKQPHDVAHLRWGCVGIVTKTTHRSATRSYLMFRRGVADVWVHPPPLWRLVDSGGLVHSHTGGAVFFVNTNQTTQPYSDQQLHIRPPAPHLWILPMWGVSDVEVRELPAYKFAVCIELSVLSHVAYACACLSIFEVLRRILI